MVELHAGLDGVLATGAHVEGRVELEVEARLLVAGRRAVGREVREAGGLLERRGHRHAVEADEADVAEREGRARLLRHAVIEEIREVVAGAQAHEQVRTHDPVGLAREAPVGRGAVDRIVGRARVCARLRRQQARALAPVVVVGNTRAEAVGQLGRLVRGDVVHRVLADLAVERVGGRRAGRRRRHIARRLGQRRLVRREEPGTVLPDRTTERDARLEAVVLVFGVGPVLGLVAVGRRQAQRRRVAGLEPVTLPVEAGAALEAVRAALGHHVDDATERAAELGVVAARLDLDFVEEVGNDALARHAALQVRGLDAVDDEPVLASARAIDRQTTELAFVVGAGRLRHEGREVAALRQQVDLLAADAGRARALLRVDQRRLGRDLHVFGDAGDAHRQLDLLDLTQAQRHFGHLRRVEARQRRGHFIRARRQGREPIHASGVGHGRHHRTHGHVAGFDGHTRQHGTGRVFHDPFDGRPLLLRKSWHGAEQGPQKDAQYGLTH